jgi:hypothetical protein
MEDKEVDPHPSPRAPQAQEWKQTQLPPRPQKALLERLRGYHIFTGRRHWRHLGQHHVGQA